MTCVLYISYDCSHVSNDPSCKERGFKHISTEYENDKQRKQLFNQINIAHPHSTPRVACIILFICYIRLYAPFLHVSSLVYHVYVFCIDFINQYNQVYIIIVFYKHIDNFDDHFLFLSPQDQIFQILC